MASTNKTANYELSQFLGSDKPAWLSDYNTDMSKIDAQMKLNADGVTSASGSASSANTAIGTLANLTTEAKTDLVSAINEVDSNADTAYNTATSASNTANEASSTATGAATGVTNLTSYLTMTQFTDLSASRTSGTSVTVSSATIKSAVNAGGSLGRIYGKIELSFTGSGSNTITITDTKFRPSSDITVNGFAMIFGKGSNEVYYSSVTDKEITIHTNGTITFSTSGNNGDTATVIFQTGLIFAEDFGD